MEGEIPEGVDPALWAEFSQLFGHIQALHVRRELDADATPPPTRRFVLDVPEEWVILFAWIRARERNRSEADNGPTGLTPQHIVVFHDMCRRSVAAYLWRTLNNHFHGELHDLATGGSALLRPRRPEPSRDDLGDGLPF